MGRSEIKRNIPFSVKLSDDESKALKAISKVEKRPNPEVVRELIREKAMKLGVWQQVQQLSPP